MKSSTVCINDYKEKGFCITVHQNTFNVIVFIFWRHCYTLWCQCYTLWSQCYTLVYLILYLYRILTSVFIIKNNRKLKVNVYFILNAVSRKYSALVWQYEKRYLVCNIDPKKMKSVHNFWKK